MAISYLSGQDDEDVRHTAELAGQRCVTIRAGLAEEATCHVVKQAVQELGGLDVLANNVATQRLVSDFTELSTRQLERTFRVNIFSYFWTSRAAIRTCLTEAPSSTRPQRPARQQNPDRLRGDQGRGADLHPTHWPRPCSTAASGSTRWRRAGVDPADPGHVRRRKGEQLRQPGADGPRRAPGRDHPWESRPGRD